MHQIIINAIENCKFFSFQQKEFFIMIFKEEGLLSIFHKLPYLCENYPIYENEDGEREVIEIYDFEYSLESDDQNRKYYAISTGGDDHPRFSFKIYRNTDGADRPLICKDLTINEDY